MERSRKQQEGEKAVHNRRLEIDLPDKFCDVRVERDVRDRQLKQDEQGRRHQAHDENSDRRRELQIAAVDPGDPAVRARRSDMRSKTDKLKFLAHDRRSAPLDGRLQPEFDDASGRQPEVVCGIAGVLRKRDEQPVLPEGHSTLLRREDRAA